MLVFSPTTAATTTTTTHHRKMFPVMSSFAEDDEEYVRSVVPQFARFGKVLQVQQCSAAKVEVEPPGHAEAFYKKSCVAVLQQISPRNSEDKWRVTLESFRNEHRFLGDSLQLAELHGAGVGVPRVLGLHQSNDRSDFSTVFRTVLEYLAPSQFREERRYGLEDAKRILEWLARFHEHFAGAGAGYLEQGGWWRKALRPTVKFDRLLPTVRHLCAQFPDSLSHGVAKTGDELWLDLAQWKQLDRFRLALGPNRTLMHGDCKSSNFFLPRDGNDRVMGIDFQWVGGSPTGAGDVVYLLFGSVELAWEREAELKRWYLSQRPGVSPEAFEREFDLELLDYFTTACPYLLAELTPKRMGKNLAKYGYLTYEDDEPSLRYFLERVIAAYGRIKPEFEEEEAKRQRVG